MQRTFNKIIVLLNRKKKIIQEIKAIPKKRLLKEVVTIGTCTSDTWIYHEIRDTYVKAISRHHRRYNYFPYIRYSIASFRNMKCPVGKRKRERKKKGANERSSAKDIRVERKISPWKNTLFRYA